MKFDYFMGWLATTIQHPGDQGEVAVVVKGVEGCGKGIVARAIMRLFGQHALTISNSKHLTGNFNAHLQDCVFLFADEALFAGDPTHVGVLKAIITEPTITIEGKYQRAVNAKNCLHLFMASNNEWVVPAGMEARRFFVIEASSDRVNDYEYFGAISSELENGGHAAMLYDLMHYDLSRFNVRAVPQTHELGEQKKQSLPIPEQWWIDCLQRGYVFKSKLGLESVFGKWHEEASTELLFASYSEFAQSRRERHPLTRETLGRFLVRVGARYRRLHRAATGEHMTDNTVAGGRVAEPVIGDRPTGYALGSLALARDGFCARTGLSFAWPEDDGP